MKDTNKENRISKKLAERALIRMGIQKELTPNVMATSRCEYRKFIKDHKSSLDKVK